MQYPSEPTQASLANSKPALAGLETAQALRSFLMPTSDSKPAMTPKSHSGLTGIGLTGIGLGQVVGIGARLTEPLKNVLPAVQPKAPVQ